MARYALALFAVIVAGISFAQAGPAAQKHMIVTAHPLASKAGYTVLKRGGSAVDATIAAQMVLTLVEPQSSGIGGGAFLVHYNATKAETLAYDGRETAPADVTPELFIDSDGKKMKWSTARIGGRAVGVPGTVRMLALAHAQQGKLRWAELLQPAIDLARNGFAVTPRLHESIDGMKGWQKSPSSAAYFRDPDGKPWPVGHLLKNPALAETLEAIAADPNAVNTGAIAAQIVLAVQAYSDNPGKMTVFDLAAYEPRVRPPVCGRYLSYKLCGMPPPSSGPATALMMLGMAERLGLQNLEHSSAEWAHTFAEVGRVAFADRNQYMADPDFVHQPTAGLLDAEYLDRRAALINQTQALDKVEPGTPPEKQGLLLAPHQGLLEQGTSHLSVVDSDGNIVSMTTTIESGFGSRIMVAGFLLNNELTDFSFEPEIDGKPVANRVGPGKRPRSSMAPMIAFDAAGKPVLVAGSPGGSRIIAYVAGAIARVLGNGIEPQVAVEAGHVINRNGKTTEVEENRVAETLPEALNALGHKVKVRDLTSGLHLIQITPTGLIPGVDPRREGLALGD